MKTIVIFRVWKDDTKDLVAFFAEQKKISPKELKEIIDLIEGKKK